MGHICKGIQNLSASTEIVCLTKQAQALFIQSSCVLSFPEYSQTLSAIAKNACAQPYRDARIQPDLENAKPACRIPTIALIPKEPIQERSKQAHPSDRLGIE